MRDNSHPTDQDLIRAADGELAVRRAAEVRTHLERCWACRARHAELQSTIGDFVRVYRRGLDPQLGPDEGPKALLRARLGVQGPDVGPAGRMRILLPIAAALAMIAAGLGWIYHGEAGRVGQPLVPRSSFTPGETRAVTVSDVCRVPRSGTAPDIPVSMRDQVFREYGIAHPRPNAYEVDYLITPELGGAESIRNLWPQPYSTVWNAHVKDMLEDRLHELVCSGQIDLATAQREIASDWIGAYKKYFHTESPL